VIGVSVTKYVRLGTKTYVHKFKSVSLSNTSSTYETVTCIFVSSMYACIFSNK